MPFLPVKPWQISFVFLSMRMDIGQASLLHSGDNLLRGVVRSSAGITFRPLSRMIFLPRSTLVPSRTHDQRHLEPHFLHRGDHALGDDIALMMPPKMFT